MISGVYKIINLSNNKFYLGSTTKLSRRKEEHFKNLRKGKHVNLHLQSSFNKYGEEAFEFSIIEECEKEKLIEREQYYIDTLKPDYNICKIAGSTLGIKASEELKKKLGLIRKGKKHSQETKEKMRINNLGRKYSEESKVKMSNSAKIKSNINELIERMKNRDAKGSKNGRAKLNEKQVKFIKIDLLNGIKPIQVACKYNVSKNIIYSIKSGETWKHVKVDE